MNRSSTPGAACLEATGRGARTLRWRSAVCLGAVLAVAMAASSARAQTPTALQTAVAPGSKVRLLAIGGYSAEGELVRLSMDSIHVRSQVLGTVDLPIAALRRLEVERTTTPLWAGVRRGMLWGAGLGVVATALAATATDRGILDVGIALPILSGSLIAGGLGGAVLLRGRSWQSVPLPGRSP